MNMFSRSLSVAKTHLGQAHTNLNMESDKIVNSEEFSMRDIDRNLLEWNKWNIPTERTDKIYRQTTFSKLSFLTDYTIKTVERTYSLFNEYETIQLFSIDSIDRHRQKYAFLHVGLVQVAVKPLTREALNASVLLCLRDDRHLRFDDSLLGMMETSLHKGPVYFNCYPNFALSLSDRNIMDALTLNVKTNGYYMKEGSEPLAIIYRIYYKLMKTTLDPQSIVDPSPKGQTLLMQASTRNTRLRVPQQIQWKDITLPERWQLEAIAPTPKIENTEPDFIAQNTDGTVIISFNNNDRYTDSLIRPSSSTGKKTPMMFTPRSSFSSRTPFSDSRPLPPQNLPPVIHLPPINTKKTPIQTEPAYYPTDTTQPTPNVHQPLYQPQPQPDSPTHTDILGFTDDRQINVLSKEFVLDKELLKYDYLKPENNDRKNQFFEEYNEHERNNLRTKYFEMMTDLQTHFSFFDFLDYHNKKISVIEKILSWTKTENHEKVYQTYPPFESIILSQNSGVQVLATPIKRPSLSDDNKNLDSIIQQNNYTNTYLKTIGQKLQEIEDRLIPPSTSIKKENTSNTPLFIPHEIPPHLRAPLKKPMTEKTDNLLNEINKKLDLMKLESSKDMEPLKNKNIITLNTKGRTDSSEDEESEDNQLTDLTDINNLESQFTDKLRINKLILASSSQDRKKGRIDDLYPRKNWYPKPTPPDLQFEERHTYVNSSYSPDLIYEWNIDGMSEYEIINLLHEMTLLTNVYKNHGKQDHQIAHLIVTGFTGQLKGWWDHYLNNDDRNGILTAVKRETDGSVIMTDRQPSQDAVNTLIFTITKHFVGDPNQYKERASDVLINLRCPQLSDFRWYKDVFISKVLSRNDCQQSYWKEKFIAGLPYFFAQKVRLDIVNNDGTIDYPSLTYGDIISSINKTGLWLCNDLRLKNQIEKEKRFAKKELGTFCEQYGFDPLIAPSRKRRKEKKDDRSDRYDRYKNNNRRYYKSKSKDKSKDKKEESKRKKYDRRRESDITCFKCGKKGHTSRYCNFQRQINKLDISKKLKDKLMRITELTDSDETDNEIHQIDNSNSTSSSSIDVSSHDGNVQLCNCNNIDNCYCKRKLKICVLTKQEDIIMDLIDKLPDLQSKKDYLSKLKESLTETDRFEIDLKDYKSTYNFTEITDRFKPNKPITVTDLQIDINNLKNELKKLKSENFILKGMVEQITAQVISIKDRIKYCNEPLTDSSLLDRHNCTGESSHKEDDKDEFLNIIDRMIFQKWYTEITLVVHKEFSLTVIALVDSGADMNCIQEGLIPSKYYESTTDRLTQANGDRLKISNKLTKAYIYNNGIKFRTPFFLTDKLSSKVILGNPFLALIYPFFTTDNGICTNILKTEVFFKFLLPPFPKDIHLLKEISISKDKSDDEIPTMADLVIDDDEIPTMVDNTILPSSSST